MYASQKDLITPENGGLLDTMTVSTLVVKQNLHCNHLKNKLKIFESDEWFENNENLGKFH